MWNTYWFDDPSRASMGGQKSSVTTTAHQCVQQKGAKSSVLLLSINLVGFNVVTVDAVRP